MDSMVDEYSIRKLSWMELIYIYIAKLVVYMNKTNTPVLPNGLKHYMNGGSSSWKWYIKVAKREDYRRFHIEFIVFMMSLLDYIDAGDGRMQY